MEFRNESRRPRNILVTLVVNMISIYAGASLLPGVDVDSPLDALIVAIVLSLLNVTIKPLLIILTLPLTLFTFGLFLLVINAIVINIAASWIDGFHVSSFWAALFFSILISIINSLLFGLGERSNEK